MSFWDFGRKTQSKNEMISRLRAEKEVLETSDEANKKKIQKLKGEAADLRRSMQQLEFEKKELERKLDREEPYDKIYNERLELIEKIGLNGETIQALKDERDEFCKTNKEMKSEMKNMQDQDIKLRSELDEQGKIQKDIADQKDGLKLRVDELEKEKDEYENELAQLKKDFDKIRLEKEAWDHNNRSKEEKIVVDKAISTDAVGYIEEARQEILEYKTRVDDLQLASEALKSENESLFRANELKAREINEIKNELTEIKQELTREQLKYKKLQQEWDEERRGTEFVLVSKSAKSRQNRSRLGTGTLETTKEENDSEDEHILSLVESAKAESEALREKERAYKKRISELQTDKADLFRSGSNLFMENKSIKAKYDGLLGERDRLLKTESALKRKIREQDKEITDLKKTVDDMYYQNIAIKANEDNENTRNAYVVVMGSEMIKTLEREKSALYRRVKYLEKENNEIESRVTELQSQSDHLIKYTQRFEIRPEVSSGRRDSRSDVNRDRHRPRYEYDQPPSLKGFSDRDFQSAPRTTPHRIFSSDGKRKPLTGDEEGRFQKIYEDPKPTQYRTYSRDRDENASFRYRPEDTYVKEGRPPLRRPTSRDLFADDQEPTPKTDTGSDPFRPRVPRHAPTTETISSDTRNDQVSHISLPKIDDRLSPRPRSHSSKVANSRRGTPALGRK